MKHVYTLLFAKSSGETFVVSSKPRGWLDTEGFKKLFREGIEQGGTFIKSWRSLPRKRK